MTTMTEDERLALQTALSVVPSVYCNVVEIADLPAGMVAKARAAIRRAAGRLRDCSYNVLRSGDLQLAVLFVDDLSTDRLSPPGVDG